MVVLAQLPTQVVMAALVVGVELETEQVLLAVLGIPHQHPQAKVTMGVRVEIKQVAITTFRQEVVAVHQQLVAMEQLLLVAQVVMALHQLFPARQLLTPVVAVGQVITKLLAPVVLVVAAMVKSLLLQLQQLLEPQTQVAVVVVAMQTMQQAALA